MSYIKHSFNLPATHSEPLQSIISHRLKGLGEDAKKKLMWGVRIWGIIYYKNELNII